MTDLTGTIKLVEQPIPDGAPISTPTEKIYTIDFGKAFIEPFEESGKLFLSPDFIGTLVIEFTINNDNSTFYRAEIHVEEGYTKEGTNVANAPIRAKLTLDASVTTDVKYLTGDLDGDGAEEIVLFDYTNDNITIWNIYGDKLVDKHPITLSSHHKVFVGNFNDEGASNRSEW